MNEQMMNSGFYISDLFLQTMPKDVAEKWLEDDTHSKLAYFWCWCEELKREAQ